MEMKQLTESQYFSVLVGAPTIIHIHHLQCFGPGSFAKHEALGTLYNTIIPLVDLMVEVKQGQTHQLIQYDKEYITNDITVGSTIVYLESLKKILGEHPEHIDTTNLDDILMDLINAIDLTLYKLNFLR